MIGVIGLGLVGGSLARALPNVLAWDKDDVARRGAEKENISLARPDEIAQRCTVVFVALPASQVAATSIELLEAGAKAVCDTASVKEEIYREIHTRIPGAAFLGGHPLSGGTGSGWGASTNQLMRGVPWALVGEEVDPQLLLPIAEALRILESPWLAVLPDEHDRLLARTSQLVQMMQLALAASMCEWNPLALRLSGPALRDSTRLAHSSLEIWESIISMNRENIAGALFALQEELRNEQLLLEDPAGLRMLWRHASLGREGLEEIRWQEDLWRETSIHFQGAWQELCDRSREGCIFRNIRPSEGLLLMEQAS